MKPLCLVAIVDDGYQEYVPLFIYFALCAYPEYEVIVYSVDAVRPEVSACLRSLRALGSFDVRPLAYRYDRRDAQNLKALRWVLYDDDFAHYENVCIGDIDMLIVRQEPGLCERRVRHSDEIGLPYSNTVRPGSRLLVGISHFVRAQAYFPPLLPLMLRYRDALAEGALPMHNEAFLYRLMEESLGLPQRAGLTTHHGIHLRAFHRQRSVAEQRARRDYVFDKVFERYVDAFLVAARAPACAEMVRRLSAIDSPPARVARYPSAGPAVGRQFNHVLRLCDALLAERVPSS